MKLSLPIMESPSAENDWQLRPYEDISRSDGMLNVAAMRSCTDNHGPGRRFSLWFQECFRRCPGCTNSHMLDMAEENALSINIVLTKIDKAYSGAADIEGITLQGGEPLLQAKNLAELLRRIKTEISDELTVLLFTGYTITQLQKLHLDSINAVLDCTDTVIDGSFDASNIDKEQIRGSTNQHIVHMTDRMVGQNFDRLPEKTVVGIGDQLLARTGISFI